MVTSSPITAPGATLAVMSIAGTWLFLDQHRADFSFGHQFARDFRFAAIPPHALASRLLHHVVFDDIAGHDRFAELGLVDGEEIDALRRAHDLGNDAHDACGLRHALDH